jgi:hypothetical protein
MSQFTYAVKNPSGIKIIISMIVLCVVLLKIGSLNDENIILLTFAVVWFCFCVVVMIWSVYRIFKKPSELQLHQESILLNGRIINADQIKVIMSMRDFNNTVIGIKPYGAKIVPINMCFRFAKDEENGIADLANWAERNKVKVSNTFFFRWI